MELPHVVTDLDKAIETSVDEIYRAIEHQSTLSGRPRSATACVSFSQEKVRRTWYSKTIEEQPWEQYELSFTIASGSTERGISTFHAQMRVCS